MFHSFADLQAAINRYVAEHNKNSAPFKWKANPDDIIAAAKRGTKRWSRSTSASYQTETLADNGAVK